MKELRRILSNRRLIVGLVLILLLNGFLFAREQSVNNYGLDLELPSSEFVFVDGAFTVSQEPVDAWAAYQRYSEWIDRARKLPLADAVKMLTDEKTALSAKITEDTDTEDDRLDYIAVNNLLNRTDYLTGYGDWLNTIQKNKDNMLAFPIFNDPNSFSGRNIIKTADEFEKLQGVELTLGTDGAVNSFMSFRLTDYFLLLVLLLIGLSFLEERKAGLWSVVHAAPRGRLRLAVRRTLILFGTSVTGVLLFYGTDLALGFSLYGGVGDLSRAVQSVETLGRLPMLATVGGFLVRFFLLRIAAAFFVSLLLWLLLTAVNNAKYAIIVAAGMLVAEYSLYTFLPVQSILNGLKYFNLFTYISLSDLYTNYLNIDLFGYPLGIRSISQLALFPLCLLLAAICILIHCYKKPAAGKDLLGGVAYGINSITDKGLRRLRLFGIEMYKMLWIQKGVVILALFIYLAVGLSFTANISIYNPAEKAAQQYTSQLTGEITEDTLARIDAIEAELNQTIKNYEDAKIAYDNGEIADNQLNVYAYNAGVAYTNKEGLDAVRSRANDLLKLGTEKGFTPWLIEQTPFESVYGTAAQNNQHRAAVVAVLALTLLLAGSMAYERQSGMTFLLGSTTRGRGVLLRRKIIVAALATTVVWATVYGMELYTLLSNFSIQTWNVPVQNLSIVTYFPILCSIKGWLVILYGYRLLVLFCGAIIVLLVSSWVKRVEIAYIAGCGVMLIPSLLYAYVGIEIFRPVAYITSVEAAPLLTEQNGAISGALLWGIALMGIATIIIVWLFVPTNGRKRRRS